MDELRRSLRMMKEDFDLVGTLSDYCKLASARHRLDVRFGRAGAERAWGPRARSPSFACCRRRSPTWPATAARHSGGGDLGFEPGQATLRIQDRGSGFVLPRDPAGLAREGHYGLANMQERARKVSGDLRMTSAPGQGTCVELVVSAGEELER